MPTDGRADRRPDRRPLSRRLMESVFARLTPGAREHLVQIDLLFAPGDSPLRPRYFAFEETACEPSPPPGTLRNHGVLAARGGA